MTLLTHRLWATIVTLLLVTSTDSHAEDVRFRLQHGYGSNPYLELCQKLEAALTARSSYPRYICPHEVPLPANDPDFRVPRWESLNPLEHRKLVEQLFWREYDWKDDMTAAEREKFWNGLEISRYGRTGKIEQYSPRELIGRGDVSLGRATFDINFDGKPDTVYRFSLAGCQSVQPHSDVALVHSFHVVDHADPELVRGTRKLLRLGIGAAFLFKGRTYLLSNTGSIIVRETFPPSTSQGALAYRAVCTFTDRAPQN